MGSSSSSAPPPAPPPPAPIDPAKSSLDYINAMADPELQQRLLSAEREFRPQYNQLNLQDLNQYLYGGNGQEGSVGLLGRATQDMAGFDAAALARQREADIASVEQLGGRASEAFRNANPQLQAALARAEGMAGGSNFFGEFGQGARDMYSRASGTPELGAAGGSLAGRAAELAQSRGQLNPDELRSLQQSVREGYASRGVEMGSGAISGEALARLTNERQRMQEDLAMAAGLNQGTIAEQGANRAYLQQALGNLGLLGQFQQGQMGTDRGYALQLAGLTQSTMSDPFQAILGRPSQALGMAQGQQGFGAGMAQSMQGPQLFDPNAGINLGLQNNANLSNYNSSIYGSQLGLMGANAQASGAKAGGIAAGVGGAITGVAMAVAF